MFREFLLCLGPSLSSCRIAARGWVSAGHSLLPPVHLLALLEGLVEAVTEGEVGLGLGALDEALDLPGTGASLLLLLAVTGLAQAGLLQGGYKEC